MLYTQFVWTERGEKNAEVNGVKETRAAGFPASFAYEPLEKNMPVCEAWLDCGVVRKVEDKLPFLHFYCEDSESLGWSACVWLKENHIEFRYNWETGEVKADLDDNGELVDVFFYHVKGNLYGIYKKPRTTTEYFGMTVDEITEEEKGYTKEEKLLMDNNIHESP